jgi:hypothetical protein
MLLSLGGAAAGVLLLEVVVRLAGIEGMMIRRSVFLQQADINVHRVSSDPFLHYELAPQAHMDATAPGNRPYTVNIDPLGARHPAHPRAKSPGTFRILCFGGSTMYGAAVNDEQTIPALLEKRLNRDSRVQDGELRRFEVWNFGTSAYTLGQATHLAKIKLSELAPDLILVQHHNIGRRPFLATRDSRVADEPAELQHPGVEFFLEQFPVPDAMPIGWHQDALRYSALYRSLTALSPYLFKLQNWPCDACNEISAAEARALSLDSEARGIPVVYVMIPADQGVAVPAHIFPELPPARFIELYRPGREAQFYDVHPPASVLDEYAALVAATLRERGLLPATEAEPSGSPP